MSVNVKLTVAPQSASFPKLMTNKDGIVVLFTSPCIGTVVSRTLGSCYKVGYHSAGWAPEAFMDFTGKIELENDYERN